MRNRNVVIVGIALGGVLLAGGATAWAFPIRSADRSSHVEAAPTPSARSMPPPSSKATAVPIATSDPAPSSTPTASRGSGTPVKAAPKPVATTAPAPPAPQQVPPPVAPAPPAINPAPPVNVSGAFSRELATTPGALPYATGNQCYDANYGQITDSSTFGYNISADRGIAGLVHRLSVTYSDTHLVGSSELNFYAVQWYRCGS